MRQARVSFPYSKPLWQEADSEQAQNGGNLPLLQGDRDTAL
jgi:hypothetical protein